MAERVPWHHPRVFAAAAENEFWRGDPGQIPPETSQWDRGSQEGEDALSLALDIQRHFNEEADRG